MMRAGDAAPGDPGVATLEVRLLAEAVFERYGFDFRHYAPASLARRVKSRLEPEGLATVSSLQERVLRDPGCMERLLEAITVHVTSMFRDPPFYRVFRDEVVPWIATWPFARLWLAGCATGEEAWSMAILLEEEGLLDRCRLYATDLSESVLAGARAGIFPLGSMQEYTTNYLRAGGRTAFSEYYSADRDRALFRPTLRRTMVFAPHNLATDSSFNEFQVILCRNVLIYFDAGLQERVHRLFYDSLCPSGVLALGRAESLASSPERERYRPLAPDQPIFRKIR